MPERRSNFVCAVLSTSWLLVASPEVVTVVTDTSVFASALCTCLGSKDMNAKGSVQLITAGAGGPLASS